MDERGQCLGGRFRLPTCEADQTREDSVRLLEAHVRNLAAVPRVPPESRAREPSRVVDEEQDELEGRPGG